MKQLRNILTGVLLACGLSLPAVSMQADSIPAAQNGLVAELDSMAQRDDVTPAEQEENTVDVKEIVFGHIGDSYDGTSPISEKRRLSFRCPSLYIAAQRGGTYSFLPVWRRTEAVTRDFPLLRKAASTKESWWSTMQQAMRCVRGIYPLRRLRWHCSSTVYY